MGSKATFDTAEALRRFATGAYTYGTLAAEMGIPRARIKRLIRRRAADLKPGPRTSKIDVPRAALLYASGDYSSGALAKLFGTGRKHIMRLVLHHAPHLKGIRAHTAVTAKIDREEAVRLLRSKEASIPELAVKYDVRPDTLRCVIRKIDPELTKRPARPSRPPPDPDAILQALRQREIWQARRIAMVERYAEGDASYQAVADEFGVSENAVRDAVHQLAPHLRKGSSNANRFDHAAAIADFASGQYTYEELALTYGISWVTANNTIRNEAPHLKTGRQAKVDFGEVVALIRTGLYAIEDVAEIFSTTPTYIWTLLNTSAPELLVKRSRGRYKIDDEEAVIALYATGQYTYQRLADEFGSEPNHIYRFLRRRAPHLRQRVLLGWRTMQARVLLNRVLIDMKESECLPQAA